MYQKTLSIIKPDAVAKNIIGAIYQIIEKNGLSIIAAKQTQLSLQQAEAFYDIHRDRPFFKDLTSFMASGPIMVQVLAGHDAIAQYRTLMGATNPQEAAPDSIRGQFADSIDHNAVHGSDSPETASQEIAFFFSQQELLS